MCRIPWHNKNQQNEANMKISILDQFAADAINAPAAVTGGGGNCKAPSKSKSHKSGSNKCKATKKTKTKSKSKNHCSPCPPPPCTPPPCH